MYAEKLQNCHRHAQLSLILDFAREFFPGIGEPAENNAADVINARIRGKPDYTRPGREIYSTGFYRTHI